MLPVLKDEPIFKKLLKAYAKDTFPPFPIIEWILDLIIYSVNRSDYLLDSQKLYLLQQKFMIIALVPEFPIPRPFSLPSSPYWNSEVK